MNTSQNKVLLCVDIGKLFDSTAIVVLEVHEDHFIVRQASRIPLQTNYVTQAKKLIQVYQKLKSRHEAVQLRIDATGVGEGITDILRVYPQDLNLMPIKLTAGKRVHVRSGVYHIPKKDLVESAIARLENGSLVFADSIQDKEAMMNELVSYQSEIKASGHIRYNARTGKHDDLVMALVLGMYDAK